MTIVDIDHGQQCEKKEEGNLLHDSLVIQPALPSFVFLCNRIILLFFHQGLSIYHLSSINYPLSSIIYPLLSIFSAIRSFALEALGLLFISLSVGTTGFFVITFISFTVSLLVKGSCSGSSNDPRLKKFFTNLSSRE